MLRGYFNVVICLSYIHQIFLKIPFCKYLYSNDFLSDFNFTGKTVPFSSTHIIMVTLCYFSSVFFSSEISHLLYFFVHCFNNIVKSKWKTLFSKLLKGYVCYLFIIQGMQKLRVLQKYITSKK